MNLGSLLADLHLLDHRLRIPGRARHGDGVSHGLDTADRCSCGVAVKSRRAHAYNEEAFRYFFTLERQRARRSGRAFLLLLVDLKEHPGARAHLEPRVVPKLFRGLSRCLRETDIIGWYREQRVAGALLTELGDGPGPAISGLLGQRISRVLYEVLPGDTARLQVRLYQHRELFAGEK
jgi:hypothetical protein